MVPWVNDPACLCGVPGSIPSLAQWVKDLALLQLQLDSQQQLRSDPWPRICMCRGVAKNENKTTKKNSFVSFF